MMTGYLAAFGYVFLLLIGIYCFGYAARKSSLLFVLLLETLLGALFVFGFLCMEGGGESLRLFSTFPVGNLLWLGASAVCGYAGGNYFSLLNLRTAGEKVNSLLSPAITALTIVFSYFIFNERLQLLQWAGTMLTLLVVIYFLLAGNKSTAGRITNWKAGMWSGVATVVCISLSIIGSIKGATGVGSYWQAVWLRLLFALVIVTAVYIGRQEYKKRKTHDRKFYAAVIVGVIAQTIAASYLWLYASFSIGISTVQVIIATLPLWVYAADVYLLKKSKPLPVFVVISLLALTGIVLVML